MGVDLTEIFKYNNIQLYEVKKDKLGLIRMALLTSEKLFDRVLQY